MTVPEHFSFLRVDLRRLTTVVLRLAVLTFCCADLIAQQRSPILDWSVVLGWLPVDTQTLIVATQPFVIPAQEQDDEDAAPSPIDALRGYVLGRLEEFPVLYEALEGQMVKFALSGMRESRRFSGLGLGPYDGCSVIVFAEPLGDRLRSATSGLAKEDWSGNTAFILSTERKGSIRTRPEQLDLFVTQLGSNILLTATDRSSLHSLLERRSGQTDRALPSGLPEWREVDMTAPVWALRHYKHTYDPQTKRSVLSLGFREELDDQKAVGLVYNGQPAGPVQRLYYLSDGKQILDFARHRWEWKDEGLATPKVRRRSKGVAEVTVPTPSADAMGSFVLLLLASLGYAIAL